MPLLARLLSGTRVPRQSRLALLGGTAEAAVPSCFISSRDSSFTPRSSRLLLLPVWLFLTHWCGKRRLLRVSRRVVGRCSCPPRLLAGSRRLWRLCSLSISRRRPDSCWGFLS